MKGRARSIIACSTDAFVHETVSLRRNDVKTACSLSFHILLSPGLLSRDIAAERKTLLFLYSLLLCCCG